MGAIFAASTAAQTLRASTVAVTSCTRSTLAPALTGIPYYWETVPAFAERGLRTVAAVLDDLDDQ